jgi:MFS family permease
MRHYWQLLRRRPNFRLIWLAQVISLTGDWFNLIAVVILVQRYSEGETALATMGLFLARNIPLFLFSSYGGVIADRFDRRWVMIYSNLVRVLIVLGFLLVRDASLVWLIYVLTIAQFIASSFYEPAYSAILPSMVAPDELVAANTLGGITWSAILALGSALGGIVANAAGVEAALLVDSASFAVAAGLTWLAHPEFTPPPTTLSAAGNRWRELWEGVLYVRQNLNIALLVSAKALSQIGSADVAISLYADSVFRVGREGATTLSVLFAAFGIGAVVGPLLANWSSGEKEFALKYWIGISLGMITLGWALFGVAPTLAVAALAMLIRGIGGSINWTYSVVLIQTNVPDHYLGRVFGLDFTVFTLMAIVANIVTGATPDFLNVSPRTVILWIAVASIVPVLLWTGAVRKQQERRTRQLA